ncbi:hypothetical protein D3C85_856090 [compost metagenome]
MQLDDLLAQRQAQAGAALAAADLDERLEYPRLLAVGNALAIILDGQDHPLPLAPCLQTDLPVGVAVAQGVAEQVVEGSLDLQAIQIDLRQHAVDLDAQPDPAFGGLGGEALLRLQQQLLEVAGAPVELLQAVLVAREIQQVVDQQEQAAHLFVEGVQQLALARLGRELQALLQQAEGHVHTGYRGAQFMRGAQHEFAAHALEGALFGDVVQHHHRTVNPFVAEADRGQAVGQQADLAVGFDLEVFRGLFQAFAAHDPLQLLVQPRALQGLADAHAARLVVPAELALGDLIEVIEQAAAVENQQAVVDAVEHRLQAPLLAEQGLDLAVLEAPQRLGHHAETLAQGRQFGDRSSRQLDLEITLADPLDRQGQGLERLAEMLGDAVRGDETEQQHGHADQAEQRGNQGGALLRTLFGALQRGEITQLHIINALAQGLHRLAEGGGAEQLLAHRQGFIQQLLIERVSALDLAHGLTVAVVQGACAGLLKPVVETPVGGLQGLLVEVFRQQQNQLLAQLQAQAEGGVENTQVVGHRLVLRLGQLQHAEHAQQQADQGHGDQRAAVEEEPAAQLHRLNCLRLRYRVEASMPRVLAAWSRVSLLASTALIWVFSSSSRLTALPMRRPLPFGCSPRPR